METMLRENRLLLLLPANEAPTSEENYDEFGADFDPATEAAYADADVSCVEDASDGRESITAESCTGEDRSVYRGSDDDDDVEMDGWDGRRGPERAAVIESEDDEERREEDRAFWETCLASGYP
ncbi:hypothetical protein ACMD2_14292 [Ananas comosus]|uniref:Uncharacterized protein n=1 Tax=Ananas comosus TaxID=4615 RepID=A0A199UZB1_ANACO|nr:hypothetical protein ACMD2_14292 [Ananas comosus]